MRIVACVRQGLDGEWNPFDASAYEAALCIQNAEVILLSMGPAVVASALSEWTRLGASRAILLCDKSFAGADTLATAYTLSKAIEKLEPDHVFCGRQTLIGDTAQTPPMLAELLKYSLVTNVMQLQAVTAEEIQCHTRFDGIQKAGNKTVLTIEKINTLRFPKLRSKVTQVEIWDAAMLETDPAKTGLAGSPTRVLKTFENESGKRKCTYISREQLGEVIAASLQACEKNIETTADIAQELLSDVIVVGEPPMQLARTVSRDISIVEPSDLESIVATIKEKKPSAVLWGSDSRSRNMAARVAARLGLGLCADCTYLGSENGELIMYRPALSGSVIAKIKSLTRPAMATVRTETTGEKDIIVALGYGVKDDLQRAKEFAKGLRASLAASRKLVDHDFMPYDSQVGLTGKKISPSVYIAVGISGAVHHIAGMQNASTVIAINPDKNAPIFEYADYGIVDAF